MNMLELSVSDIMTREPISVKPDENLIECVKKIVKKRVGCLLVNEKGILRGIITSEDILWALTKKDKDDFKNIKAIDISPKKIATIKPNATIKEALHKMKRYKFERLPVVKDKELVGLLTAKDILNFHPELYPELEEFYEIREQSKKLKKISKVRERRTSHEGVCEECGNTDFLFRVDGQLICDSCRDQK